jgi:membrane protein YqaA with SNARE-associated domain
MSALRRTILNVFVTKWRSRENLARLGLLLLAVAIIGGFFWGRSYVSTQAVGYGGVALSSLIASGGMIIPVPALAVACAASVYLNPLFVALIAATAETIGELTGYTLGYTGRGLVTKRKAYQRLESWMHRQGWLVLLALSVVPNPLFDLAGITAGVLRYPLWGFLAVVLVGKLLKFLALAYGCAWGIAWVTDLIR